MSTEQRTPVAFRNRQGFQLFGVLHTPTHRLPSGLGVILLSPGVKMRVGPQRLYIRLTDELVRQGLPVLRFDFYGLGDSEGSLTEEMLRDVYNHIEVGRFVDDTLDAMDWMQGQCGTSRFILSGLCGGAITGLLAGARDSRVAGLHALGITSVLASRSANPSLYTSGQLDQMRGTYLSKIWSPKAWLRLLSLKSDYRVLWRALTRSNRRPPQPAQPGTQTPPEDDNANPLFPPAFFSMLNARRPMLLVFGASDRLQWEFEEKFAVRHREALATMPPLYDVHTIEHANHVLSFAEWQQEMIAVSTRWLEQRFADDLRAAPSAGSRS
jgi:hypothetical protein